MPQPLKAPVTPRRLSCNNVKLLIPRPRIELRKPNRKCGVLPLNYRGFIRIVRIELTTKDWKSPILPLNYIRIL